MDSMTWQQPRGSVFAEKTTWLLLTAFALLVAGMTVNQSTTAFFTDTRVVSGNNFITASVALNETPFTAFNFEKFVPGDVFVRPVQVTNSTASNSGAINVNYYMTVKDNFTASCSVQDPKCTDSKGTLSDPVNGLRLVAIRCFSDATGQINVACESTSLRSVRLVKGVMETIWPNGEKNATTDIAGVVRDRNATVQYGNIGATGSEDTGNFPGLPNDGVASDYFGRPIVFARAGALSTQPISVKINPRRNETGNPAVLGSNLLTNTSNPVVQGSDVLRIGGSIQDLDGNWSKNVGNLTTTNTPAVPADCGNVAPGSVTKIKHFGPTAGCGAEVVGVPIQTLSNPNCNGLATAAANRAVINATGNQGSQAGPGPNATAVSLNAASGAPQVFSTQSHGACFMGGSDFEKNAPIVLSPRINNQLMTSGGGETPRISSDIPSQSLFDNANTLAGLGAGKSDNLALIVYLPSWSTQSTQDETGTTALTVQSRQTLDAQNNPITVPIGGAGNGKGGRASYTVAFTAVQPVGQTFALANVAQQSVNTLAALAGQITTTGAAFQAQNSDTAILGTNATLVTGGIQLVSPSNLPGEGRQIVTVAGRGFAKVEARPQSVLAVASTIGGTLGAAEYKYVVTANTTVKAVPTNAYDWTQSEPSALVAATVGASSTTGSVTITWDPVPNATSYTVFRNPNVAAGTYDAYITVDADKATLEPNKPNSAGFRAGAQFGVVDIKGEAATKPLTNVFTTRSKFPANNRPCVKWDTSITDSFGQCPKIEILDENQDGLAGTTSSDFTLKSGEVLKLAESKSVRTATTDYDHSGDRAGLLLQVNGNDATDATKSLFATTEDTAGVLSSNQVVFEAKTTKVNELTKYGVRVTNSDHPALPLDVRGKVATLKNAITVIPQKIDSYTPKRIGRISTGNQLVISGSGFQQGAVVQLGIFETGTNPKVRVNDGVDAATAGFVSKSHILSRHDYTISGIPTLTTLTALGTWYADGYKSDIPESTYQDGAFDATTGLLSKDSTGAAFFSYDHKKVTINNASTITIKDITITNATGITGGVGAKIFNPDGSVSYTATFGIAAPGIEEIVQVDASGNKWMSAAQGQRVTLWFRTTDGGVFTGKPSMAISCYRKVSELDLAGPYKGSLKFDVDKNLQTKTTALEFDVIDPCYNPATGAKDVGITQIGDLEVISSGRTVAPGVTKEGAPGMGDAVKGVFQIAPLAKVELRKFTMTNGDAAVFSNYFPISQAPTFAKVSITSGLPRLVANNLAVTGLENVPTVGFNIEGRLPRGTARRVLITGSGFVRGSFASMKDPLNATLGNFGARNENIKPGTTKFLLNTANSTTTTPGITFSNSGVRLVKAGDSENDRIVAAGNGVSDLTTVVKDTADDLAMSTTADQKSPEDPYKATKRLTTVIYIDPSATAGPVTMTITNPDGGQVVVPNAFIVDGKPTLDAATNAVISDTTTLKDATVTDASINQGQQKLKDAAIVIYGSGFFNSGGAAPQVSVSGSGVRVVSTRISNISPDTSSIGTPVVAGDANKFDTMIRVELIAESTAPLGPRVLTVVLPDGQSVSSDSDPHLNGDGTKFYFTVTAGS